MSNDILKPEEFEAFVARRKLAWREHAIKMTWEEKIAAIERMWERDKSLRIARDAITKARLAQQQLERQQLERQQLDLARSDKAD